MLTNKLAVNSGLRLSVPSANTAIYTSQLTARTHTPIRILQYSTYSTLLTSLVGSGGACAHCSSSARSALPSGPCSQPTHSSARGTGTGALWSRYVWRGEWRMSSSERRLTSICIDPVHQYLSGFLRGLPSTCLRAPWISSRLCGFALANGRRVAASVETPLSLRGLYTHRRIGRLTALTIGCGFSVAMYHKMRHILLPGGVTRWLGT